MSMARTCGAKIQREFKHAKADSVYPTSQFAKPDQIDCGGDITLTLSYLGGDPCNCGDYCYCSDPEFHIDAYCSRCKYPYFEGIAEFTSGDARDAIERALNGR